MEKKGIQRITAILLVIGLILTGCGGSGAASADAEQGRTEAEAQDSQAAGIEDSQAHETEDSQTADTEDSRAMARPIRRRRRRTLSSGWKRRTCPGMPGNIRS